MQHPVGVSIDRQRHLKDGALCMYALNTVQIVFFLCRFLAPCVYISTMTHVHLIMNLMQPQCESLLS